MAAQDLRGYAAYWRVILGKGKAGQTFSLTDIQNETSARRDCVREYMSALEHGGYIEAAGEQPSGTGTPARLYRLAKAPKEAPRLRADGSEAVQGRAREQMWRTIHMLGRFTLRDLVVAASTERIPVKESDVKDYLRYLRLAGYLASQRQALKGGPAVYRLLPGKYTGPRPPMVQRVKQVFDPNLNRVVWPKDGGR